MSRRIDIELTSHADGVWTWRAAGAKLPKGSLAESVIPEEVAVGDVLRAEVESGLTGIEIVALAKPASKDVAPPADRIEVIGIPRRVPDVMVSLAPGSGRRRDGFDRNEHRDTKQRRSGPARREPSPGRPSERSTSRGRKRPSPTGANDRGEPSGRNRDGQRAERRPSDSDGRGGPLRREREQRLATSTAHRNALLATYGPEQLPVAEQLLRGGIPAVRQAVAEQRRAGPADAANADRLLAIAEELLPAVNLASWKDRAAAAQSAGKELRLRDLRAVVAASRTVTLDEEGRDMARSLRESLDHRVTALRQEWAGRVTAAIDGGRMAEALRIANRPPEPATRLPSELAVRLAGSAGAAMSPDLSPDEWLALLDAVLESPVRRMVKPTGIPSAPEVQQAARHAAGLVPELAKLLGLRIPPPPPRRVLRFSPAADGGSVAAL